MNTIELVTKIKEEAEKADVRIPQYIDVENIEDGQLRIKGKWMCMPSVWGVCFKNGSWIYFSTDSERGYISGIKELGSEEEVCDYAYNFMKNKIYAIKDGYSRKDKATRYIVNKYGYMEDKASQTVGKIAVHEDIFEELYGYMRRNRFVGNCIEVEGFTAKGLVESEGFTAVAAYRFLAGLCENPSEMKGMLKDGTMEKE